MGQMIYKNGEHSPLFVYLYLLHVKHKLQRKEDVIVFPPLFGELPGIQNWCGTMRSIHAIPTRELNEQYPVDAETGCGFKHLAVKLLRYIPFENKIILLYWNPTACWSVAMVDNKDCLFSMHGYQLEFRKQDEGVYDPPGSAYTDVLAYTHYKTIDAVQCLITYVRRKYDGHKYNDQIALCNTPC